MKKRYLTLALAFLLALMLSVPALALTLGENDYVIDEAGLLTEREEQSLRERIGKLSEKYHFGIYIVTVENFLDYKSDGDVLDAAEKLYLDNNLGLGERHSGILLMLSMDSRDYALFAFGWGNRAFTDFGKEYLSERFLDDFKHDHWYGGFKDYVKTCEKMLQLDQRGEPLDAGTYVPLPARIIGEVVCILGALVIAFIVITNLRGGHQMVKAATQANAFTAEDGLKLTERYDNYTHTTTSRVYCAPQSSSSGSRSGGGSRGGGTTIRSSGGSGRSGKF